MKSQQMQRQKAFAGWIQLRLWRVYELSMHANAAQKNEGEDAEAESATVLLVDDQPVIGLIVRKMLSSDPNISFHECNDATEAINKARACRPTVILQDLDMPGANGLDLVMAYRSIPELRNIPLIVLSSNDEPAMKKAAFAIGANDYLVKLPEPIELMARVRYHSRSYMALLQRDHAYRALHESQAMLRQSNMELQRLTKSDGLTGLANRRYFNSYIEEAWAASEKNASVLSLLMIDVDYFKLYNDTLGHLAGDDALQRVAQAVQAAMVEPMSLAARFGGEEFAVVLPLLEGDAACLVGERVRRRVEALDIPHPLVAGASVTVSIGVATMTATTTTRSTDLIAAADARLYCAKCDGRNRVVGAN